MIKIVFPDGVEKVQSSDHLYQWDKGQQIEISGLGDVGTPEIHIGYTGMLSAVVVKGIISGVSNDKIAVYIPDKVLMTGKDLRVHINIATNYSNTTIKSILIPVIKRNMPENYVIEDGDLKWIEEFKDVSVDFNNRITSNSDDLSDLTEQVSELKSDLGELKDKIYVYADILAEINKGYFYNGSFESHPMYEYTVIDCVESENYKLSGFYLNASELPFVLGGTSFSDMQVLVKPNEDTLFQDYELVIPNGITKIIIQGNVYDSTQHIFVKKAYKINDKVSDVSLKIRDGFYNSDLIFNTHNMYIASRFSCDECEFYSVNVDFVASSELPCIMVIDENNQILKKENIFGVDKSLRNYNFVTPLGAKSVIIQGSSSNNTLKVSKLNLKKPLDGKRCIIFGDSISEVAERWRTPFIERTGALEIKCYAVAGAHLRDYPDTILDGNPRASDVQNTICNQVYQLLSEIDNIYDYADFVIISAGTNDNFTWEELTKEAYNCPNFFTDDGLYYKNINDVDRTSLDGAMRWQCEKILDVFPNAKLFFVEPIQGAQRYRDTYTILRKGDRIHDVAKMLSCVSIPAGAESGIYGEYEIFGQQGKYLLDGLHPNSEGGKVLGKYIANKVIDVIEH